MQLVMHVFNPPQEEYITKTNNFQVNAKETLILVIEQICRLNFQ